MEEGSVKLLPGDKMWLATFASWLAFEYLSDDLLSDSAARIVKRHPVIGRAAILTFTAALAGHLAVVLPSGIDIFNNKNIFHQNVARSYRQVEARCRRLR